MEKKNIRLGFLLRLLPNLKLILSLVRDYLKGTYRDVSDKSLIIFILTLAYIIIPIDLIPDYIIGFGQLDDFGILGLSLYFLENDLMKYKGWKERNTERAKIKQTSKCPSQSTGGSRARDRATPSDRQYLKNVIKTSLNQA